MLKMNKTVEIPLNEWYCNNSKGNGGKAKRTMIKFENIAKVAIVNKNGETNPYIGTKKDDSSNYLTFKMWKKMATKESTLMITKEEQLLILIATRIIR